MLEEINPLWATRDAGAVRQWMADGADPGRHIVPTIRQMIADGRAAKAKSMKYFTAAVMEAAGARPANGHDPEPEPDNAGFVAKTVSRAQERGHHDDARAIIDAKKSGGWDAAEAEARRYLEREDAA